MTVKSFCFGPYVLLNISRVIWIGYVQEGACDVINKQWGNNSYVKNNDSTLHFFKVSFILGVLIST